MTREELFERMSWREFCEWMAFEKAQPFGEAGDYLRAGIIAAQIVNMLRDPKKGKPASPLDFVPKFEDQPKRRQSAAEQRAILRGAANARSQRLGTVRKQA